MILASNLNQPVVRPSELTHFPPSDRSLARAAGPGLASHAATPNDLAAFAGGGYRSGSEGTKCVVMRPVSTPTPVQRPVRLRSIDPCGSRRPVSKQFVVARHF
jgi:hypothetical protein